MRYSREILYRRRRLLVVELRNESFSQELLLLKEIMDKMSLASTFVAALRRPFLSALLG